ncbi:septum formation protein Maf [Terasakiispira papahanaumokuakeensis]|uniref:7-methyl-GTP pyrophosphatase n=1 Tax=Terasakiispira papahanaumokuakeensis TaxID=197479 RepID=A0A1E2V7M6_9GAMM|nr:nucleoside triphosphate pyrophosphatase [Terasakiispira papahanaumokuakeensis]ODC02987.1 septum formation protein Maf [Terasakiispira papahanaumokuakeensis]
MRPLILASGSIYRQQLLQKLRLPFVTASPDIDETPLANETPSALVKRLAWHKAAAVAEQHPDALVIGSDQVCIADDSPQDPANPMVKKVDEKNATILGKPGTPERAVAQLMALNGRRITLLTGLCLFDSASLEAHTIVEPFTVHFRTLSRAEIEHYVALEQPLDCAGSFKAEGLGITLFERLEGDDPNTLIGLPLIRLTQLLQKMGVNPLAAPTS